MKSILESLFGVYSPVISHEISLDGTTIYPVIAEGMAGVDWTYVLGIFLFGICLYSAFRIIGMVISK